MLRQRLEMDRAMFDWDMLWAAGVAALATVLWLVWQRRWAGGSPAILNGSDDPPVGVVAITMAVGSTLIQER
jgi:hypothetical protein